jgi:hypothetical protein
VLLSLRTNQTRQGAEDEKAFCALLSSSIENRLQSILRDMQASPFLAALETFRFHRSTLSRDKRSDTQ